ncbi:MAG: 6,7-dimethyl-8-ribityllumazine synthase [Thermovirgaceae bacterium]|nr:6,7-dimethyl-8-ribityllumazine synthase [Thermovirgaceae bacterium]
MRIIQGKLIGTGLRFLIAVSRFNELISSRLLEGAKDFLLRHDVSPMDIDVVWVPGSWELPLAVRECALTGKYDAMIALGAIIRGDTPHFDFVAAEVSKGLAMVGMEQRVPVSFGVLTCDTLEQALLRAGSKSGNKGSDAAAAAIEMADLLRQMRTKTGGEDRDA